MIGRPVLADVLDEGGVLPGLGLELLPLEACGPGHLGEVALLALEGGLGRAQLVERGQVARDDLVLAAGEERQVLALGGVGLDVPRLEQELEEVEPAELVEGHHGPSRWTRAPGRCPPGGSGRSPGWRPAPTGPARARRSGRPAPSRRGSG
ncbi:MAG: hypothetical protein MZV64_50120 [Ignavibacteriales bacterium]|nr:hypothetical protein [Ignavibacteriales bacterium]